MLKLPRCLRIIKSRGIAGELELFHQLLRTTVIAFQQPGNVDVEFDKLCRFAFFSASCLAQERFKSIARRGVILFLQRHQRQIELGLAES